MYICKGTQRCMYVHAYISYAFTFLQQCVYINMHCSYIYLYIQHMDIHTYIMYYVASCFFLRVFVVFVFVLIENLNAVECGLHCCCYCHARSRSLLHVLFTAAFGQRVVVCFVFVLLPKLAN